MQAHGGTKRLSLDVDQYSRQVHYMTDNGAYYCFCNRFNSNKPWDVPMYQTVNALQRYHESLWPTSTPDTIASANASANASAAPSSFLTSVSPSPPNNFVGLYHLDPFWHSHHPDGRWQQIFTFLPPFYIS
jgi:hypothetical protein